jgi:hypothetical protein
LLGSGSAGAGADADAASPSRWRWTASRAVRSAVLGDHVSSSSPSAINPTNYPATINNAPTPNVNAVISAMSTAWPVVSTNP